MNAICRARLRLARQCLVGAVEADPWLEGVPGFRQALDGVNKALGRRVRKSKGRSVK